MSQENVKALNKKIKAIYNTVFSDTTPEEFSQSLAASFPDEKFQIPYAVYLTVCNTLTRAKVWHGAGATLQEAWDNTMESCKAYLKKNELDPKWIKIEIANNVATETVQGAVNMMFSSYNYYFRMGISLDMKFRYSFTEGEINGYKLINYKNKSVDMRKVNDYLMVRDDDVMISKPKQILIFDTIGYFCDEQNRVYKLHDQGPDTGRRIMDGKPDKKTVLGIVSSMAEYLKRQVNDNGMFDYGFWPLSNKPIEGYNMLRHTSSIWAMICADEHIRDSEIYSAAKKAIGFMLDQIDIFEDGFAFMKDKGEIKLGAGASAIVMLTEFMRVYDTDEYTPLCILLGEGILKLQDEESGQFTHVLDANDLSVVDEFRTVFYDGEATFALLRLYGVTKEEKFLTAAIKSVDHFIEADYTKFKDHWVAYSVNELTKYVKEEKYFEFGLKNAQVNLEKIYYQATSYNVFLELLLATYEMYDRIISEGHEVKYLNETFEKEDFFETIFKRADFMLNNYGYPELIMYFKKPSNFKGAYSIRQDSFRTRIDDVQHTCGGYVLMYKNYDSLIKLYEEPV